MGTADDIRPVNTTTSFVDQNQTYASHPSHQVFLRQYELNAAGDPVATGKLIEGANGGMATWGEVKAQASDDAWHQADGCRCRQRAAAADRRLRQLHPRRRTACRSSITGIGGWTAFPTQADDIVLGGDPAAKAA